MKVQIEMNLYLTRFRTDNNIDGVVFRTIVCNDVQDAHMHLDLGDYELVEMVEHMLLDDRSPYKVKCYEIETEDLLDRLYVKYRQPIHRKYSGAGYCAYDAFLDYYEIDR